MFGYDEFNNNVKKEEMPPVLEPIENLNNENNYVAPSMDVLSNEVNNNYNLENDILDSYDRGENLNNLAYNNISSVEGYNTIGNNNVSLNQDYNTNINSDVSLNQDNNINNYNTDFIINQEINSNKNKYNETNDNFHLLENKEKIIIQDNNFEEKQNLNTELDINKISDTSNELNYEEVFSKEDNEQKNEEPLLTYKCVEKIAKLVEELKNEGYDIQLSEFDFEKLFQLVIKINK